MKVAEYIWDTYVAFAVVASISAMGMIAASLFYIKDALEYTGTTAA